MLSVRWWSIVALGASNAAPASGQRAADGGILRLFQAGKEIGRETFVRTPGALETETAIPLLGLKLRYRSMYDAAGALTAFEARIAKLAGDSVVSEYRLTVDGDSLRLTQTEASGSTRTWAAAARPDLILGAQSLATYLDVVRRAARRDTVLHGWSPELNALTDVTVAFRADTASLEVQGIPFQATLGPDGRVLAIEVPVQRIHVERWQGTDLPPLPGLEPPTPDYSAPAGAPYTAQEVRIPVQTPGDSAFELVGTLTVPTSGTPPYPTVVTITGSGGQDRDENLWPLVPAYRPFRQIAERLSRSGIAALRVDDRGTGASGGVRDSATMLDFADDLRAQLAWLRVRPEVDPDRIALLGHSEGGVVGPLVAASDPKVAALVILAGTAKPGTEVLKDQFTWPIESTPGLTPAEKARLTEKSLEGLRDTAALNPWMRHFREYDPVPTARRVRQPVLILHGALDRQVTVGQADTLAAALREAGNRDVTLHVFPRLNHLFLVSPTDGSPVEYAALEETAIPLEVLDLLAGWVAARLAPRRAR